MLLSAGASPAKSAGLARHALPRHEKIGVPQVLSAADIARYREIFEIQRDGAWELADKHIRALQDRLLMGYVLSQRYLHPTKYRSSYDELRDWMVQYRDHPDAQRIYELALRRKPKKAPEPLSPSSGLVAMVKLPAPPAPEAIGEKGAALRARVDEHLDRNEPQLAEALLDAPDAQESVPATAFDRIRADVATAYYLQGEDRRAYALAAAAAKRSNETVPQADWIAGLASYRTGRLGTAAVHFARHARSPAAGQWSAAAGAYWAARCHLQIRQPTKVERWLRLAASYPRTFYGQIAQRALGLDSPLDWSLPAVTQEDIDRVFELPGGRRAIALVQMGEIVLAEEELRTHVWKLDTDYARSLLAVADAAGLPNTAIRAGVRLAQFGADAADRVLYPEPPWSPRGGFKLDRALLYAFMRQESVFYSRATSAVGAVGLMQLMPGTAMQVSAGADLPIDSQKALYEPDLNISLGQQYLAWLLVRPGITGDLFKLAVAYNAGIGNLRKWEKATEYKGDPLLFIESIPSRETRTYVERVMANFWIYRQRLGQPSPSLDAIVAGEWPAYVPFDQPEAQIAQDVPN